MKARFRLRCTLLATLLAAAFTPTPSLAAVYTVTTDAALRSALAGAVSGDTINFGNNITILQSVGDLPVIQSNLTINGNGYFLSGGGTNRGLFAYSGNSSINNLTIRDAVAQGGFPGAYGGGGGAGLGGGLFIASGAAVTITQVQFSHDQALGSGGNGLSNPLTFIGGGGGMGGHGGGGLGGTNNGVGGGGGGLGFPATSAGNVAAGIATGLAPAGSSAGAGGASGGTGGFGQGTTVAAAGGGVGGFAPVGFNGGNGGFGGGGGATCVAGYTGGDGGFGGGGGGSCYFGGNGGFGGGAGGGVRGGGSGGFGGGDGGRLGSASGTGGGGGAGMGGAIFVMQGGKLSVGGDLTVSGGVVRGGSGGSGGQSGQALGAGMFLQGNGSLNFQPAAGQTISFADGIADQTGSGGTGANAGVWGLTKFGAGTLVLAGQNSFSGGIALNTGVLQLGDGATLGGGALSFAGGALNLASGSANLTQPIVFNQGAARFQVDAAANLTLGQANGDAATIYGTAGLIKSGAGTLTLDRAAVISGGTRVEGGALAVTPSGKLSSDTITVAAGGGIGGYTTLDFQTLTVLAGGTVETLSLVNPGILSLQGGSLKSGVVFNMNRMDARGLIAGRFINEGDLVLTGTLTVHGQPMANNGTLNLNGMSLFADALENNGVLQGRGAVGGTTNLGLILANGGGTLLFTDLTNGVGGQVTVENGSTLRAGSLAGSGGDQSNLGVITLNGGVLSGGFVDNQGRIEGSGAVLNKLANQSGGMIAVGSGATLNFNGGLVDNSGLLAVSGGRFDNKLNLLSNSASGVIAITGVSSLASGSLSNAGTIRVNAANLVLSGRLDNSGQATLENSNVQFQGLVSNTGTLHSTRSGVTFLAGFNNSGVYITDPNITIVTQFVNQGAAAVVAAQGDLFQVSGDMLGDTRNNRAWNTSLATLEFSVNAGGVHVLELSGVDFGAVRGLGAHNFSWGDLRLDAGQSLTLSDASANWIGGRGALYIGVLELDGLPAGGDLAAAIAQRFNGNGYNVYYDPLLAGNAYLGGKTWSFGSEGGALIALAAVQAVPEPGPWVLMVAGLGALASMARRRRGGAGSVSQA